ncbi:MAG TPA: hypothetical protein VHA77_14490 [Xanthobacteraceae bacterium]|jgi:hypothetical protein|nr:hypothetical protein [Xanthobacteraceae bacterium]
MKIAIWLGIAVAAYYVDATFFGGIYSQAVEVVLRAIAQSILQFAG